MSRASSGAGRLAPRMNEFYKLDLKAFQRAWFESGFFGTLTWSKGGDHQARIGLVLGYDFVELRYRVQVGLEEDQVVERFSISFSEQPLGGQRRWVVCNGCGRRCRILIGGKRFRCRLCYQATYPSQYERVHIPGLVKAENAREKLGAVPGISNPLPMKPAGMHWQTYRRLETQNAKAAMAIEFFLNHNA